MAGIRGFVATNAIPVDKVAGRVMSKGFAYEPNKKVNHDERLAPFKLRKTPEECMHLVGIRKGRLTVLGLSAEHKGGIWCCRCDCGTYVPRKTRSVKNPENWGDRCQQCQHLAYLKKNAIWRETGKDVDVRSL